MPASDHQDLTTPLTALTYQALCYLDPGSAELDELGDWTPVRGSGQGATTRRLAATERAQRRRLIARGGDAERMLGLLHPNGRALLERMRALGPSTLILDECHHLLEMWGALLGAVLDVLGEHVFVVGLTATPPDEMAPRERELYERLFGGPPDFEVPTPALVKEGDLAPYQELALLTEPLPREAHYVATQERRFQELVAALLDPGFASMPFIAWLDRRIVRRDSNHGAPISWSELRRREPELAVAALRLLGSRDLPVPEGAAMKPAVASRSCRRSSPACARRKRSCWRPWGSWLNGWTDSRLGSRRCSPGCTRLRLPSRWHTVSGSCVTRRPRSMMRWAPAERRRPWWRRGIGARRAIDEAPQTDVHAATRSRGILTWSGRRRSDKRRESGLGYGRAYEAHRPQPCSRVRPRDPGATARRAAT